MTLPLPYLHALLPELALLGLMAVVLLIDLLWRPKRGLGWVTALGLLGVLAVSLAFAVPQEQPQSIWGNMLRHDGFGFVFRMLFLVAAFITALLAFHVPDLGDRGSFYLLLLTSTLGMMLMAGATNLLMAFLAVETASIPLYVMAAFFPREQTSAEAGYKYMLFGALASAVLVYGMTLLYGLTGTTDFAGVVQGLQGDLPLWLAVVALLLVLAGFAFKLAAVPFHFWAPDVYTGAPTPIAGFLSTASKAAGFAILLRFILMALPDTTLPWWGAFLAALAAATMTVGNFLALAQRNIKRLLAYSSIAHAGYILIGVVAASQLGVAATVFYLVVYLLTNLAAFGSVVALEKAGGSSEIRSLAGLYKRSPFLSLYFLTALLSLAGVPPFSGFVAKIWVFAAAVKAGLIWLAVVGVLNSIVGLYYYLIVLKVVYQYDAPEEEMARPVRFPALYTAVLGVLSVLIVVMGVIFAPWFAWGQWAAQALLP